MTRGYHHGSTSNALATFWKLGKESAVWDTEIKTDMEWITKKPPSSEAHNLDWFDAVAFVNTTGNWNLNDEQKQALLSFVHDDGKGLVLAHAALDANVQKMYLEAVKWAMKRTEGSTASHPKVN